MIAARRVFVDTSGWYALTDSRDTNHTAAARRFRRVTREGRPVFTTNYVIGESYTLVMSRLGPRTAQGFLHRIRASAILQRTHAPESWEEEAEHLLAQHQDQVFSYVDAISFVAMRHLGIQEALAFDRDFIIAGFTLLGDD
jgi:uncharacterized protein